MDPFGAKTCAKVAAGFVPALVMGLHGNGYVTGRSSRARRPRASVGHGGLPRATLYFDLASPYTYLAAERAERLFAGLEWQPAFSAMLHGPDLGDSARAPRPNARRCSACRWPGPTSSRCACAARCASPRWPPSAAAPRRSCSPRRAWRSAAASTSTTPRSSPRPRPRPGSACATRSSPPATRAATGRSRRPGAALLAAGATCLPALRVGRLLFCGEDRLHEAAAARAAV